MADTAQQNFHTTKVGRGIIYFITQGNRGGWRRTNRCRSACPPDGCPLRFTVPFDSPSPIADTNFLGEKMNRFLPKDIAVHKIVKVKPDAHARFDALSRTYNYILTQKKNPFNFEFAYFYPSKLNFEQMNEACLALFNYTDFTSFSKLHTDVKTNNCTIYKAEWKQSDDCWIFTIKANRLLRNMVRDIVGTLQVVGRGKQTIDEFCRIIEAKNRCKAGSSVPGHALYLTDIEYPDELFI